MTGIAANFSKDYLNLFPYLEVWTKVWLRHISTKQLNNYMSKIIQKTAKTLPLFNDAGKKEHYKNNTISEEYLDSTLPECIY